MSAKPAAKRSGTKAAERPIVSAAIALSWDGRIVGRGPLDHRADAVFCDASEPAVAGVSRVMENRAPAGSTGRSSASGDASPVIHYSARTSLRTLLKRLRANHHIHRIAVAPNPPLFRRLAAEGLLDELHIAWRPRIVGGKSHAPITGMDAEFLPRGVVLDLLKLTRKGDEYLVTYRVHGNG
jgi:riboflavin biosynthesis pyrimidine reductase